MIMRGNSSSTKRIALAALLAALGTMSVGGTHAAATNTAPKKTPTCHGHLADIVGTKHHDNILASGEQVVVARGGNDFIHGAGSYICAGPGHDRVVGDEGAGGAPQRIYGGHGDDVLKGGGKQDNLSGGRGDDRLDGGTYSDFLLGGPGDDVLRGGAHRAGKVGDSDTGDEFYADPGDDTLIGGPATFDGPSLDQLYFLSGTIASLPSYGARVDLAKGTAFSKNTGHDTLRHIANVSGTSGNDVIIGNAHHNDLRGQGGHDRIHGRGGDDYLDGGDGTDRIAGGRGTDSCFKAEHTQTCEM
jgi:Ca2+-binding RTX toxin-like protein